jgi:nucleotide-binding universal stress UspA family protein
MWSPKKIAFMFNPAVDNQQALKQVFSTALNNQASLTIISVINPPILSLKISDDFTPIEELENNLLRVQAQALKETQLDWEQLEVSFTILVGDPDLATVREIIREDFDLLVKTVDNQGLLKKVFGREDMRLLRKSPCPVWLVQPKGLQSVEQKNRKVLAAIDVNDMYKEEELEVRRELNLKVLQTAYSIAASESIELHVVSCWQAPFESSLGSGFIRESAENIEQYVAEIESKFTHNFDSLIAEVNTQTSVVAKTALIKGAPDTMISKYANDVEANLVIMGTVARRGIAGLVMGNTAESILDRLEQSVVAVKPTGFVSPVKV